MGSSETYTLSETISSDMLLTEVRECVCYELHAINYIHISKTIHIDICRIIYVYTNIHIKVGTERTTCTTTARVPRKVCTA